MKIHTLYQKTFFPNIFALLHTCCFFARNCFLSAFLRFFSLKTQKEKNISDSYFDVQMKLQIESLTKKRNVNLSERKFKNGNCQKSEKLNLLFRQKRVSSEVYSTHDWKVVGSKLVQY